MIQRQLWIKKMEESFRRQYPQGENFVLSSDIDKLFRRLYSDVSVRFIGLSSFVHALIGRRTRKKSN